MKFCTIAIVACFMFLNGSEAELGRAVDDDLWEYVQDRLKERTGWRSENNLDQPDRRDAQWDEDRYYRERRQTNDANTCSCKPHLPWNPVCGTNGVTYDNMQHLECCQNSGINVRRRYMGACMSK